ncbi:ABC transporter permease, partial [bacterium]|nr:ABC transporter permease [bacterium]
MKKVNKTAKVPERTSALNHLVGAMRGDSRNLMGLLVLWAVLLGFFTFLLPESFTRVTTFQAMMFQIPELGLLSLAMVIPLISGGLNLAIIATTNQTALLMGWILTALMPPDAAGAALWMWLGLALLAGLVLCIIVGVVTGYIVVAMGVHPILVTLGTMTLLNG